MAKRELSALGVAVIALALGSCALTAGEMIGGLFYFNYPAGTGLVSGTVFGRIAGAGAAAAVLAA